MRETTLQILQDILDSARLTLDDLMLELAGHLYEEGPILSPTWPSLVGSHLLRALYRHPYIPRLFGTI